MKHTGFKITPLYRVATSKIPVLKEHDSPKNRNLSVRLLPVMCFPSAFRDLHIREYRLEAGILRAAGIYAIADLSFSFPHMADPHQAKVLSVLRTFYTIVILAPAEPVPHDLYI